MGLFVYVVGAVHQCELAVAVHDKDGPFAAVASVVHDVVGIDRLELGVREMREVEPAELVGEGTVVLDGVVADRDDFGAEVPEFLVVRPKGG